MNTTNTTARVGAAMNAIRYHETVQVETACGDAVDWGRDPRLKSEVVKHDTATGTKDGGCEV